MGNLDPESSDEFFADEESGEPTQLALAPVLSGKMFLQAVQYPVMVEMWDKKNFGAVKRAYLAEFDEKERAVLSRWQARFRKWHLQSGTPQRVMVRPKTLTLLQRAVNFFGTI